MTSVLGVDPGAEGGVALLCDDQPARVWPCHDGWEFNQILKTIDRPTIVYVEEQASRPSQASNATHKAGQTFGEIIGVLIAREIPYDFIRPTAWTKMLGIKPRQKTESVTAYKRRHAEVAARLYPHLNFYGPRGGVLDGLADAILVATAGRRVFQGEK